MVAASRARVEFHRRMAARDPQLRLYAILDAESCDRSGVDLLQVARAWRDAGVQLMQYRDKHSPRETVLGNARALRALFPLGDAFLILNDYADLVEACDFDGVHVGQSDATVEQARAHIGPDRILGVSTHSADQAHAANSTEADYIAIGPVFATRTKPNAEPAVGLCGVQAARAVVTRPLVAIGGIGLGDARAVEMAGADSVAVINALLTTNPALAAEQFLQRLR